MDSKITFPIDLVVPYVNNLTSQWKQTYIKFCTENNYVERANSFNSERYRDWGYFRYFFRGVNNFLPFIRKVFLILQDEDQIPTWLNEETVNIVFHRDFIPAEFLPTYNSTTIEMFLHRIEGLSEHFIYSNDDMYPLNSMTPEDFFSEKGKVKMGFRWSDIQPNALQFQKVCLSCYTTVAQTVGATVEQGRFIVPFHEMTPMIKSHNEKLFSLLRDKILDGITPFRNEKNYNQYIFPIYELLTGNAEPPTRTYIYANMEDKVDLIKNTIATTDANILVLNDNEKTDLKRWGEGREVRIAFEQKNLTRGKYEKAPKVTICICSYNAHDNFKRCLNSLPNREDIEIIVLDDKSTDDTLDIASVELKDYKNYLILLNEKNMGVGYNRNVLLEVASGKYIFFLDSDDYIFTDVFIEIVDKYLNDQNVLMPKYIRNDGFTEIPNILRGVFVSKDYIGNVRFNPSLRCYEDTEFRKRLFEIRGMEKVFAIEMIVYHYNKPRIGSLTWEYRKKIGDPSYQKDEELWEKYRRGKRG